MNNLCIRPLLVLTLLAAEVVSPAAGAMTPEQRGYDVFAQADRRNSGFGDLEVELRMILRTASGQESERELRIRQLEMPQDGDRVLLVFDKPLNIRGTALLSHGHKTEPDDQWLFLPAVKRVKKIASRNKSGPFVGSEFAYEDLRIPEVEKYAYRYLRSEVVNGLECHVVERVSKEEFSGYAKEIFWVDQHELRTQQVHYLNARDELIKVLQVSDYRLYVDRYWKPGRMVMRNLRTGKSTELVWRDYQFGNGFSAERDLSVNSLRRAR